MASTSETGHAKNVANFEKLISHCTGYGIKYNPSQALIKLAGLNTTHTAGKSAIETVDDKKAKLDIPINNRQTLYKPLDKFTTRLINALKASGPTDKTVADARTLANKIQGIRASELKKEPQTPAPVPQTPEAEALHAKQISASQQSYDSILENLRKLVELLEEEPLYNPNEPELKITALKTQINTFAAANTAVINANTDLENARTNRDHILYDENTGLVDLAQEVKSYVKSVYGATSSEFSQIKGIKFTRPKKH